MTDSDRPAGRAHETSPLDTFTGALRTHGVPLPGDLAPALRKCVRPVRLDAVAKAPSPDTLVRAWRATRQHRDKETREAVWIPLLHMFREHFARPLPGLEAALRAEGMHLRATRREVALQFGGRCFHLGQRLHMNGQREPARFLLTEAVDALDWGDRHGQRMPIDKRCACNGQLAVALVLLARDLDETDPEAVALLRRAERHSAFAEQRDTTEEHFAYRAEIHLRLFRAERTPAHLEKAHTVLRTPGRAPATRRLRTARADVLSGLGLDRLRGGRTEEGLGLLREAEAAYTQALDTPGPVNAQGAHPGYLLARRGHVRHQLYRFDVDADGRRGTPRLEAALGDLLTPESQDHMTALVTAAALLDRSRVLIRRGDGAGSAADLARAREALDTVPEAARLAAKVRVQELDGAVDAAVAAGDAGELRRLAREIVRLPSDAPIPSAALSRACRNLAAAEGADRYRELLEDALDRIEIDVTHPKLSPPGRRHVAGHAALIARLLARSGEDTAPVALDRALTLYRISFDALDDPPAADACADAGACALARARTLAGGGDAEAEEAAGLLREAVDWLEQALAKARRPTSAVRPDFDPVVVHSRLGEAALRSWSFTPTDRLLETAIGNLEKSLALEAADPQAAELRPERDRTAVTGHLGDAYYRRGTRNRDADDLEHALALKEETYSAGNQARENRSLAAAAAERLYRITADAAQLTRSAVFALEAATCDPDWPWPVLQLADLARQSGDLDAARLTGVPPAALSAPLLTGDRPALLQFAAELAARNREFAASVLGGQRRPGERGVFVLNDGHRLIEQTIVLKRLDARAAARERDWTQRFRAWLTARHAPDHWLLPEPLGLVRLPAPHAQDAVYVMRRVRGRLLGATVADRLADRGDDPLPRFADALRALAAFQAWRALDDPGTPRAATGRHAEAWAAQVDKACRKLDTSPGVRTALHDLVRPLAAPGSPVVAKKDPHPGNWILTRDDGLVLIDVESDTTLPLLQEAVTVIDDLPLRPLDEDGRRTRLELYDAYLAALNEFGLPAPRMADLPAGALEALTALHAVKGIGRIQRWSDDVSSFTLSLRRAQYDHYWSILDHLAAHGHDAAARAFARLFVTEHGHTRTTTG
ncbi:hypothetical protein AB0P32_22355 [Streptomyces sp. NPDC085995]|uniref:hypothetical protein n=1 Tax=Streptomyces sp. NPDC085995 TaxID=3154861 RepID=UPI003441E152